MSYASCVVRASCVRRASCVVRASCNNIWTSFATDCRFFPSLAIACHRHHNLCHRHRSGLLLRNIWAFEKDLDAKYLAAAISDRNSRAATPTKQQNIMLCVCDNEQVAKIVHNHNHNHNHV